MSLNDKDYQYPLGADAHVAQESIQPTSAKFEEPSAWERLGGLLRRAFTPAPKPLIQPKAADLPKADPYKGLMLGSGDVYAAGLAAQLGVGSTEVVRHLPPTTDDGHLDHMSMWTPK